MPDAPQLDFADIQANVVRGYSARLARHFAVTLAPGSTLLRALMPNLEAGWPTVTSADAWQQADGKKPHYCLMLGITSTGLAAIGVPPSVMTLFPKRFLEGPAAPESIVIQLGDDGPSQPSSWILGAPSGPAVHLLLSLYVHSEDPELLNELSEKLTTQITNHGATIASSHDATALPDGRVHFGFRDSLAQPTIKGVPRKRPMPDMQPDCEPGEFLLGNGYKNQYDGNFLGDIPPEIGANGSYGAFRILRQDVAAFEELLDVTATNYRIDRELVAAKLMGRWRNGTPLTLSPHTEHAKIPEGEINNFDYASSAEYPTYLNDDSGFRCPVASHVRRMNPRNGTVMGHPHSRRIIRRAMPYGPEYRHGHDDPSIERGLIGYFICGDIEMQYEFLVGTWGNLDFSQAGMRGSRDPIIGAQPPDSGRFVIRINDSRDPIVLSNLPRWVTTRGSLYCFIPGIGGLRHLASLSS